MKIVPKTQPEYIWIQFYFLYFQDISFPTDLTFKNGTVALFKVHDPDPSNIFITLECKDTCFCSDVCSIFKFVRRTDLSSNQDWFGTLRLVTKLNYIDRSVYQLTAIAKVTESLFLKSFSTNRFLFQKG